MSKDVIRDIQADRTRAYIRGVLSDLVDDGLLHMGVDPVTGETIFWATTLGETTLGMETESVPMA